MRLEATRGPGLWSFGNARSGVRGTTVNTTTVHDKNQTRQCRITRYKKFNPAQNYEWSTSPNMICKVLPFWINSVLPMEIGNWLPEAFPAMEPEENHTHIYSDQRKPHGFLE